MFWAQFYTSDSTVRIAAHRPGLYAICFFLALYCAALFLLIPGRRRLALPHPSKTLAEVVSWCYMSHLLGDRAFARCETRAELVARLVGQPMQEKGFLASLTNLAGRNRSRPVISSPVLIAGEGPSGEKRATRDGEEGAWMAEGIAPEPKTLRGGAPGQAQGPRFDKAAGVLGEEAKTRVQRVGGVRYGFGVYVGRDGREHLGIDRVRRVGGREMVLFEDKRAGRKGVRW